MGLEEEFGKALEEAKKKRDKKHARDLNDGLPRETGTEGVMAILIPQRKDES